MGVSVCARDAQKITKETMVEIRVSDPAIDSLLTPLDLQNPAKKMKLLPQSDPLQNSEDIDATSEKVDEQDEDDSVNDAEPIGDVIRVSDDSGEKRNHFRAFDFDGNVFNLEDTVLVAPEEGKVKPSVAIIKDIFQVESGSLMVCGQRFYRPEETEKIEGGTWESRDARELYYSSSLDELDTCNVMHKCVIHLIPQGKTLPDRRQQPGFIVQKVYDFATKKLRNLTEKDCEGIMPQPGAAATA